MIDRADICSLARHVVSAGMAVLLLLAGLATFDRLQGPPQGVIMVRALTPIVYPNGVLRMSFTPNKFRDCPISIRRFIYRLDDSGARTGERWRVVRGTYSGRLGISRPGDDETEFEVAVPADAPAGDYEYVAEIERQCVPFVGRKWVGVQTPARFTIVGEK